MTDFQYVISQEEKLKPLKNISFDGVVRVHICLPNSPSLTPGIFKESEKEVIININLQNMSKFSPLAELQSVFEAVYFLQPKTK